jgi:hypothetical protein
MSKVELEFAVRSVQYLRSHRLRPDEIVSVLRDELECPEPVAKALIAAH